MEQEPTLNDIEDYNNQESDEKRSTVKKVIIALLIFGVFYSGVKLYFNEVDDAIKDAPQMRTHFHQ
jgi:hypothetical protein